LYPFKQSVVTDSVNHGSKTPDIGLLGSGRRGQTLT